MAQATTHQPGLPVTEATGIAEREEPTNPLDQKLGMSLLWAYEKGSLFLSCLRIERGSVNRGGPLSRPGDPALPPSLLLTWEAPLTAGDEALLLRAAVGRVFS